jgi:hypothetical protein
MAPCAAHVALRVSHLAPVRRRTSATDRQLRCTGTPRLHTSCKPLQAVPSLTLSRGRTRSQDSELRWLRGQAQEGLPPNPLEAAPGQPMGAACGMGAEIIGAASSSRPSSVASSHVNATCPPPPRPRHPHTPPPACTPHTDARAHVDGVRAAKDACREKEI